MVSKRGTKNPLLLVFVLVLIVFGVAAFFILDFFNMIPKQSYTSNDFGISTITSSVDYNGNGIDDYTDIVLGARIDAENHPTYDSRYWDNGYPPDDVGVCTDVIWRAFKNAGYSLRDMVDADIGQHLELYPINVPDSNIDFRRVVNLRVFFDRFAVSLTCDTEDNAAWQPGDIVIFGDDDDHIGIISDKRTKTGRAWVIHNGGQPIREEDALLHDKVTGHYRFDAALIDSGVLLPFID